MYHFPVQCLFNTFNPALASCRALFSTASAARLWLCLLSCLAWAALLALRSPLKQQAARLMAKLLLPTQMHCHSLSSLDGLAFPDLKTDAVPVLSLQKPARIHLTLTTIKRKLHAFWGANVHIACRACVILACVSSVVLVQLQPATSKPA